MKAIWKREIDALPVSVNAAYHKAKNTRRLFMTPEAKAFKQYVSSVAKMSYQRPPSSKPLFVNIFYTFPDNRRRDVTNYDKVILDALEGYIYENDTQIQKIIMSKTIQKGVSKIRVEVYEY